MMLLIVIVKMVFMKRISSVNLVNFNALNVKPVLVIVLNVNQGLKDLILFPIVPVMLVSFR